MFMSSIGLVGRLACPTGWASGYSVPSLDLDFSTSVLDPRITFTRAAGPATYYDVAGLLQTSGTNVPRFDYDPQTHAQLGLLIEEARTNSLLYSGDFTQAIWIKGGLTLSAGTPGPNGATTGSGFVSASGGPGYVAQGLTSVAGTTYTISCFAKAANQLQVMLLMPSGYWADATQRSAQFNLSTGTITSTLGGGATSTMIPVGNGWYRVSLTTTPTLSVALNPQFARGTNVGDNVTVQYYAFGAQIEVGAFLTSYIPTTTATATRPRDEAHITPINAFTRASTATYFDVAGVLQTAGIDVPRPNYDPITHVSSGLLIEEARTNQLNNSGDFSVWSISPTGCVTITNNAAISPDGTNNAASVLTNDTLSNAHVIFKGMTGGAVNTTYVGSIFAKAGSYPRFSYNFGNTAFASTNQGALFDLSNGTIVTTAGGSTATITNVGNGWYRLTITGTSDPDGGNYIIGCNFAPATATGVSAPYTPASVGLGGFVYGAQAEAATTATSYILSPAGTTATRAADVVVSTWFNAAEGTLALDYDSVRAGVGATTGVPGGMSDNTFPNSLYCAHTATVNWSAAGGSVVGPAPSPVGMLTKTAASYAPTFLSVSVNGSVPAPSGILGPGPFPWSTRLSIGCSPWSLDGQICGHVRRVRYWSRALPPYELQETTELYPSLDLSFIGLPLDPRIAFSRAAGPATYFDLTGTLQTAGTNVPRIDYDPVARAPRGLLIEEARTNTLTNSGDFTNASWVKSVCTLSAGTPGPNGAITGSGIISNAGVIGYLAMPSFTPTPGTTYTASMFAKANSLSSIIILMPALWWIDATNRGATYNLVTGVISAAHPSVTSTLIPVGNGWWRCTLTATPDAAASGGAQYARATANGDGTTIQHYAFGAQLEVGAYATSYIPTTTVAAARPADVATMPIGPWFNAAASSLAADYIIDQATNSSAGHRDAVVLSDGTTNNRMILRGQAALGSAAQIVSSIAGAVLNSAAVLTVTPSVKMRLAGAWDGTVQTGSGNGGATVINARAMVTGITTLSFGNGYAGGSQNLNGWLSRVRYWPRALSNTELQTQTT